MSEQFDHIDIFDKYLHKQMTEEEASNFKERLKNEVDVRDQFQNYQSNIEIIIAKGVRNEMSEIVKENRKKSRKTIWLAAASLSLIVVSFLLFLPSKETSSDLFEEFYKPYPNIITTRSVDEIQFGMRAYSNGNFESSIQHLLNSKNSDTTNLYLGLSYLSINKPASAIEYFKKIEPNSLFNEQKLWFIGLTHLALNNNDSAFYFFNKIQPDEFKFDNAEELMKKLK